MKVRSTQDIGGMIRDGRSAKAWDQQTLADRAGVSRLWISEVENGKSSVRLDFVLRTLAALDLDIDIGTRVEGMRTTSRSAAAIAQLLKDRGR